MIALIGLGVLCVTGCGTVRRTVTGSDSRLMVQGSETVEARDSVVVAVHDTLTITKTVTIRENENGDTVRMTTETDRERVRSISDVRSKKEEVRVVRDTVYVERRDSVEVSSSRFQVSGDSLNHRPSTLILTLKWVFALIVAVSVLLLIVKFKV